MGRQGGEGGRLRGAGAAGKQHESTMVGGSGALQLVHAALVPPCKHSIRTALCSLTWAGRATTGGRSFVSNESSTAPVLVAAATRCGLHGQAGRQARAGQATKVRRAGNHLTRHCIGCAHVCASQQSHLQTLAQPQNKPNHDAAQRYTHRVGCTAR